MSDASNEVLDFVRDIISTQRSSEREAMSMAAVGAFVDGNTRQKQVAKRMDAQVDAMLKAKYEDCGHPDAYVPPSDQDDDMSSTFINCKIVGDEAINSLTNVLSDITKSDDDDDQTPPQDNTNQQQPSQRRKTNGLTRTLAAAALGAALVGGPAVTYLALKPSPPPPTENTDNQIILTPGDASQIKRPDPPIFR